MSGRARSSLRRAVTSRAVRAAVLLGAITIRAKSSPSLICRDGRGVDFLGVLVAFAGVELDGRPHAVAHELRSRQMVLVQTSRSAAILVQFGKPGLGVA